LLDPQLARRLNAFFEARVPKHAYRVRLDGDDRLQWIEATPRGSTTHGIEPHTSASERATIALLSRLPIDWLL
jgi:hypothetical protein